MNQKKTKLYLIGIIIVALVVGIISFTYAFYSANVKTTNQTQTVIKAAELNLIFTGTNEIVAESIIPGDSFTKTFTVENTADAAATYNIYLEEITNGFNNDLVYILLDENGTVVEEKPLPKTTEGKVYIQTDINIDGKQKKEYTLKVEYKYLEDVDQSENAGAEFSGTFGIDTKKLDLEITLDSTGGTLDSDITNVVNGQPYGKLPVPERVGYSFTGWYTSKTEGEKVEEDTIADTQTNPVLYARWNANSYALSFNSNGGDAIDSTIDVTYDQNYGELPTPVYSGYKFMGWYTDTSYNTEITKDTKVDIVKDTVLYAKWGANTYTITFDTNDGNSTDTTKDVTYNETYGELPTPQREGYSFAGWYNSSDELINSTTIVNVADSQTLYAKWNANKYKVEFDANGGTLSVTEKEVTYDNTYGELPTPQRDGYTFEGWYTKEEGGDLVTSDSIYKIIDNEKLIARWTVNKYIVEFDANGGEVDPTSKEVTFDTTYGDLPTPTYTGYKFVGWFTQPEGGEQYTKDSNVSITENQILYANWVPDSGIIYTVKHWQQNLDGNKDEQDSNNYTLVNTQALTGTTNDEVTPDVETYEGFTSPKTQTIKIKNDGSAVVNYYYSRNSYTLTIDKSTGINTVTGAGTHMYGANINITYTLNEGYSFTGITGDMTTTTFEMPARNVSVKLNAKANKYSVNFHANGGEVDVPSKEVTYNETYGELPTPIKTGYKFMGWFTDTDYETQVTEETTVKIITDQTLYARWTANTYTVSFDANGGDEVTSVLTVTYDGTYGTLPTPNRLGYTFKGWYTDKTGGTQIISTSKVSITDSQKLYARWENRTFTINFNANEGTVDTTSKTVTFDSEYGALPTPTRTGYTFVGWFTDKTGGTQILSDAIVKTASEQTLYARWSNKTYTVNFEANGGQVDTTSKQVVFDKTYETLPTPTKTGYTFAGWYTDKTVGTKITSDTKVAITDTQTLYARWTVNTYTVSFNANGGKDVTSTITVTYGKTYGELPVAERTGYIFRGWYTDSSYQNQIVNSTDVTITSNQTLIAKWEADTYTVTFNPGTGSVNPTSKEVTYDGTYGELPTPSLTGYTFNGWFTSSSYTTQVTSATKVAITSNQTLYAKFTANQYTVTVDANGGSIPTTTGWTIASGSKTATKKVTYDSSYSTLPTPTKTGYTFAGWFTDTNYTTQISSSSKVSITSNQTLIAKWTANEYTVTFSAGSGTVNPTSKKVTYDGTYGDLPTPTLTGYTFNGWFTSSSYTTQVTSSTKVSITANQTLYAKYTANIYKVTLNNQSATTAGTKEYYYQFNTSKVINGVTAYYYTDSSLTTPLSGGDTITIPVKTGYVFNGYYTEANGAGTQYVDSSGGTINSIYKKATSNTTLYAYWTPKTDTAYTVKHWQQKIGGTASSHDSTNYAIANTESLAGTTGASVSPAVKSYTGFTAPSKQSVTIKADGSTVVNYYYTRNSYTLTINKSTGVSSVTGAGSYQYGASVTVGYTIATGYTFSSISGDYTTKTFTMPAKNTTVKVNATANQYTVTVDANNGTIPTTTGWTVASGSKTATKKVTYASTYGTLPTPTRTGYTFAGWYTATSGGTQVTSTTTVSITSNQTLYARWTANTYSVSFDANGGNAVSTVLTVTYAGTYGTLPTPTRTGYTFAGWYTAASGGTQVTSTTTVSITAAQKLYAHWTINSYKVTISATNATASASSVTINYAGSKTATITPNNGYYLSSVSCTNGYTVTASTGVDQFAAQTVTIKNNSKTTTSTCTFTASRINATALTYSNSATTCTNVQCSIDELYTRLK